jgi:AraC-like DNA-binding protein
MHSSPFATVTDASCQPAGELAAPRQPAGALKDSGLGIARLGSLQALPEVLQRFAVDLPQVLQRAGLAEDLFADPERRIAAEPLGRLFKASTELTGCEHLGLLLGARFSLEDFVELGGLLRNCATVGDALQALLLHLHAHDRLAAPLLLDMGSSRVLLGYSPLRHGMHAPDQLQEVAIGIAFRLLRELCGPGWKPLQVQFAHARPGSVSFHRHLFCARLCFDAEVSGVVFDAAWLKQAIPGADPRLREQFASALLQREVATHLRFSDQVVVVLHQLLLAQDCSSARVSAFFGIQPRTLRLRLRKEGTSLQGLLDQVRFELAKQLLQSTHLSLLQIAGTLCYADQAVFSRAFRSWAQVSPLAWRKLHSGVAE